MSKINSIIRAYNGVENKKDLLKTVIKTIKKGGFVELKNAAKRSADRGQEAETTDLYDRQQQNTRDYEKTEVKVLFVVLVEQIDADIRNSIESIVEQKCVDKEIVVIACKGFRCPYEQRVREFDGAWGTSVDAAVKESNADYVCFLRGGDYYAPNMSGEFFAVCGNDRYDMIYSDECISDQNGRRYFLKPDYSEFDLLYRQYIGQSIAFSRIAIMEAGGIDIRIVRLDDLLLDLSLKVAGVSNRIKHIDKVLMLHQFDFHESIDHARIKIINNALHRGNVTAEVYLTDGKIKFCSGGIGDKFSIILSSDCYERCCDSVDNIMGHTDYISYELILVCSREICEKLEKRYEFCTNIKYVYSGNQSYTGKCNLGAEKAEGEVMVFLADDARVLQNDWLYRMGTLLAFPNVGAVSPKIIRNENTIRYAGMIAGGFGFTPIPFNGEEDVYRTNWNEPVYTTREISVLSSTCLLVRKPLFEQVRGFAEGKITDKFSNAVLSFELACLGVQCVYCADVALTAGSEAWYDSKYDAEDPSAYLYLLQNYADFLSYDPHFTEAMKQQYLRGVPLDFRIYKKKITKEQNKGSILMVSHDSLLGGATIALQYAARALNKNGYYVTFLLPEEGGMIQELEKDDIHYIVDSTLYGSDDWMRYAGNYDVVFLSTIVLGKYIRKLTKYTQKIIWWVHEASEYYQKISLEDYDISDIEGLRVYCGGSYAQKMFQQYFPGMESKVLLYGMPDYAKLKQNDNDSERLIFLSIGTIEKRKGQDILVDAIHYLTDDERMQCRFVFIGKNVQEDVYEKITDLHKTYPESVEMMKPISRDELMCMYEKCTCVICSSREDPMPVFMTECMMQARIAICSENTGTAGVLRDGYDGLIYQNNDPRLLAEKIRYVINQRGNLEQMKSNARDTYEKVFAMEVFEEKICEELQRFIG